MADSLKHFSTGPRPGASPFFTPSPAAGHSSDVLFSLDEVNEDEEEAKTNEALQRLLTEVTLAVTSEDAAEEAQPRRTPMFASQSAVTVRPHVEDDPSVLLASFSVSGSGPAGELQPAGLSGARSLASMPAAAAMGGGFVVKAPATLPAPPPVGAHLPPPPVYGTPSVGAATPYSCYSGIPASHPGKAPPSFAEAVASTTPLSLQGRSPAEMTPMAAHYVPPGPATVPDPILLRNSNGVFLLNPVLGSSKPTPPYTPPTGTNTPPISPLPRYSLPPPQGALPSAFLGASVMHAGHEVRPRAGSLYGTGHDMLPPPPQYNSGPVVGYTQSITSVRGTPSFGAAPPPYSA